MQFANATSEVERSRENTALPEHSREVYMYLLMLRCIVDDVGHQAGQQLGHSIDATSEGPIGRGAPWRPASLAGGVNPMPDYRVYHIENAKLVGAGGLPEVGVDLFYKIRLILSRKFSIISPSSHLSHLGECQSSQK